MQVLKVELEAPTTSFRYPHFMVGRHPTFDMPPPATIYGHVCSVCGKLLGLDDFRFGYRFTYSARADDLEHLHIIEPKGGRANFEWAGEKIPKNIEGTVVPTMRDFLFDAKMTLYLDRPDLLAAFACPRYAVGLGRSQDLATITCVQEVELQRADRAYFEHTLLPAETRLWLERGLVVTMPRYLEYARGRAPHFDHYLILQDRVFAFDHEAPDLIGALGTDLAKPVPEGMELWVDPDTDDHHGARRAVWLHGFV